MSGEITQFLWFDGQVEQAVQFYASVFKRSKISSLSPMSASFELNGQQFLALNGGPLHKFTPAISLFVSCETQEEIDYYWDKLSAGGAPGRCGWLTDQFGLSWQVVPTVLGSLLGASDRAAANRALQAMLTMQKLDIARLKKAFAEAD